MRGYLVDEGQVPLDSCLILLPLQPELVAELLLGLFDVSVSQLPLLSLWGAGTKQPPHGNHRQARKMRDRAKARPWCSHLPPVAAGTPSPPGQRRRELSPDPD